MVQDCSTESPGVVTEIIKGNESRRPVFTLWSLKYRKACVLEFIDNHPKASHGLAGRVSLPEERVASEVVTRGVPYRGLITGPQWSAMYWSGI